MSWETPKSSGNKEISDLRYRISQLENLVTIGGSIGSPSFTSRPSNSVLLNSSNGLLLRLNELEGLLAASEHDNQALRKEIEAIKADRNRQEVYTLEKVFKKDTELKDLQHDYNLLEMKYQKAETKLGNIQEYIIDLPCKEELDEAQSIILQLQEDNQLIEGKLNRMTDQVHELQRECFQKERVIQDLSLKLEDLKPLEEAQLSLLKEKEIAGLNLSDEESVKKLLTVHKAQLLRSTKMISILREKLFKVESDKAEAIIKISNQESDIQSLQEQCLAHQLTVDRIEQKSKTLEHDKVKISLEVEDLKKAIEQRDSFLQLKDEQAHNLMELVTEIDICVVEMNQLVDLGRSIATGEEPPVSALFGISDELEEHFNRLILDGEEHHGDGYLNVSNKNLTDRSNSINKDPNSTEWSLTRLKTVRDVRKNMNVARDFVSDLYTDILGEKVTGCKVQ